MEARAIAKHIRIAPRKIRIVADIVRGKNVSEAFAILKFTPKVGSRVVEKVLRSAVANAEQEYDKFHRQRQLEAGKKESDFDKAVKVLSDGKI